MITRIHPFVVPLIPAIPVVLVARTAFATPHSNIQTKTQAFYKSSKETKAIIEKLEKDTHFQETHIREEIYAQVDKWLTGIQPSLAEKTMPHLSPNFLKDMNYVRMIYDGNPKNYNAKKRHDLTKEFRDLLKRYNDPYETEILTMLCSHYGLI